MDSKYLEKLITLDDGILKFEIYTRKQSFTGRKFIVKGSEFGIVSNSRSGFLGCYSHFLLVESGIDWSPLGNVETDLWILSQLNTFYFSTSSVTTVHCGPWFLIQSSIPSGVWRLYATFLFPLSYDSLQPLQTITKYIAVTLYCFQNYSA